MTFHDILLNPCFSYGATGGPGFLTNVVTTQAGFEQRNINWSQSRGAWDVSYENRTDSELDELKNFFEARYGKAYSFRYIDWLDYNLSAQSIGSFTGVVDETLQIFKTYTSGGESIDHDITKPVDVNDPNHTLNLNSPGDPQYTTMTVTIGGSPATEGVDYTVDYSTGLITNTLGATGAVVVACSFHYHARFDTDRMDVTLDAYDNNTWGSIAIVEVKGAD